MNRRRRFLQAAGLAGVMGLSLASGQPPEPLPEPVKAGLYVGPQSCATSNCHGSVRPRRVYDVLQNEYFTWFKGGDRHRQAYEILFNAQSAAITRHLRLGQPPSEAKICLDCHALAVPKAMQAGPVEIEDGISCESCHGPASGWIRTHTAEDWTYRQSVEAGMTDLRALDARARLCLSCHLGDPARSVDHDLIAAGHPELVFELDNYTQGMPAHWMPLRDKKNREGLRDTHGASAWGVGQAASFRGGLDQLARRSRSQRWPEFSEMRCESCHHPLTERRWQTSRFDDRPGLPRWSPARWAVLRHVVAAFDPAARSSLDGEVEQLARQVARMGTPPAQVAETAERISRALSAVIPKLESAEWSDARVRGLLLAIASDTGDAALLTGSDRQSCEQAYLALNALVGELLDSNPRLARTRIPATLESLRRELEDPYRWSPARFADQLARLERQLQELR